MLISAAYKTQNQRLHNARPDYGTFGSRWLEQITDMAEEMKTQDVLDYGCGKQTLKAELPFVTGYDPCIAGLDAAPAPATLVICTDVLEHVEPECLEDVLDDLKRVTGCGLFCTVAKLAAKKTLPDGRNAHLILEPPQWWLPKFFARFEIQTFQNFRSEFLVIASPIKT
jgi:hypothetical protein